MHPTDEVVNAAGIPLINDGKNIWVDNGAYHNLVIGSTGSGKTQTIVKPMVNLLAKKGESMIITDPKGEIYKYSASYLKEKGELDIGRESTFTPGPVHRLDRNTSGIVIFGKTLAALQDLNEMMKKRHHIEKSYMTICKGKLTKQQELVGYVKKIDNEDRVRFVKKDDKDALMMKTIVKPIRTTNDFSLVEVKIITGRMHQIRIHLSSIDHPVIGDRKYGDFALNKQMKQQFGLNNQLLHAYKINFVDPFGSLSYLKGKIIICPKPTQFKKIEKSLFESVL